MTIQTLLDSTRLAAKILADLTPARNKQEFEQYRLMTDIRVEYLTYQKIEKETNDPSFTTAHIPPVLTRLNTLMADSEKTSKRFTAVNKAYFHPAELEQETYWRTIKPRLLYERLSKTKSRTPAGFPQSTGK
jgi:DNA-binding XRE family transcriptional regulator